MRKLIGLVALCGVLLLGFGVAFAQPTPPKIPIVGGCSVTTSSAECIAAVYRWELTVENTSATATIACAFATTAVLNSATSFMLRPGQYKTWSYTRSTAPPGGPMNCIGDAAGTLRVEYI